MHRTLRKKQRRLRPQSQVRHGFTLVEMLVAVALVLLMMTMFTAIFQMATDSVSRQRGIAENDQRVRNLTINLRADMAKRTMVYSYPFRPNENPALSPTPFGSRAGYIYISTNSVDSGQDNLIQFSVDSRRVSENFDDTPYFGAAELLYDIKADPANDNTLRRTVLQFDPNQPEADDASMRPNGVASSPTAEVSLFLRNGQLIRRTMLLRQPLAVVGDEIQPASNVSGNTFFQGNSFAYVGNPWAINTTDNNDPNHFQLDPGESAPAVWNVFWTDDFWRHFDFSAIPSNYGTFDPTRTNPLTQAPPAGVTLVGHDALNNESAAMNDISLGKPRFRFGFNPFTGLSREHDNPSTGYFIGRYLQAETSSGQSEQRIDSSPHPTLNSPPSAFDFNWPIRRSSVGGAIGNPMDLAKTPVNLNLSTGIVTEFQGTSLRGGPRRVEDVLLNHVQEFLVEVWDDRVGRFVTPGYGSTSPIRGDASLVGDYHILRRINSTYGPLGNAVPAMNNVYDTWHPVPEVDSDVDG
ncbi:MAG: prepilin-type N-terminal cleavage/methylation domain-containing protein, partial [Planctomycetaceae bacterium]|nr:prepilin-type N-terminal cleavage/methylation domain-containing protein [Planctomycetaceae bacterium]